MNREVEVVEHKPDLCPCGHTKESHDEFGCILSTGVGECDCTRVYITQQQKPDPNLIEQAREFLDKFLAGREAHSQLIEEAMASFAHSVASPTWVPVGKALPDTTGGYLVTGLGLAINIGFFTGKRWLDKTGNTAIEILAWMPLPDAYSTGGKDGR